jgi:hypothetical protein
MDAAIGGIVKPFVKRKRFAPVVPIECRLCRVERLHLEGQRTARHFPARIPTRREKVLAEIGVANRWVGAHLSRLQIELERVRAEKHPRRRHVDRMLMLR